jgi:myotubularin-related protein 6/7/8
VVVHCSDGWDRTAQTCSLAGFLLDSYYRTIEGFITLVEKEWLGFGHKFSHRIGHLAGESREVSPIFLQFLECTWQILQQFPRAFEFNELFLITLYDAVVSCKFGTFLGNCELERQRARLSERTHSLWSFILARRADFVNPLYDVGDRAHQGVLLPSLAPQHFTVWLAMYCRFDPEMLPRQRIETHVTAAQLRTRTHEAALRVLSHQQAEVGAAEARLHQELAALRARRLRAQGESPSETPAGEDIDPHTAGRVPPSAWVLPPTPDFLREDDACSGCRAPFEYLDHRGVCRACGHIFCASCLRRLAALPQQGWREAGPACNACYKTLPPASVGAAAARAAAVVASPESKSGGLVV